MHTLPPQKLILPFVKQAGKTSFASLSFFKKALGTKKIGHTGTLDNFADGVMIAVIGSGTKLAQYFLESDKTYIACIQFGRETDTLDPTGAVVKTSALPTLENVRQAIQQHIGRISQIPPAYSNIHIDGKRASAVARKGAKVALPARQVNIYQIELLSIKPKSKEPSSKVEQISIRVRCSKGTYIRSLARDIAKSAESCGFVMALRRTAIGNFSIEDCLGHERLQAFDEMAETNTQAFFQSLSGSPCGKPFNSTCVPPKTTGLTSAAEIGCLVKRQVLPAKTNCKTCRLYAVSQLSVCETAEFVQLRKLMCARLTNFKEAYTSAQVVDSMLAFSQSCAERIGLGVLQLKPQFLQKFYTGQPIQKAWFFDVPALSAAALPVCAVFCDELFCGVITEVENGFSYNFVITGNGE